MNRMFFVLSIALFLTIGGSARAEWGKFNGTIKFNMQLGQYCDSSAPYNMNCTGSQYTKATFGTDVAFSNVVIRIVDQNNTNLGESQTNSSGQYTITWTTAEGVLPTKLRIRLLYLRSDGRFGMYNPASGNLWATSSQDLQIASGTVKTANINYGGTEWANSYTALWRGWEHALKYSSTMLSNFVSIKVFVDPNLDAGNASADFVNGSITYGLATGFFPMTIHHEMGHLAVY